MSTISPSLKVGLQFLGAWPDTPYATIKRLLFMSSILIMQYFQYLYVLAHCKPGELQNLVDGLPPTLDYSLTFIKLVTLWVNHRVVREILVHMDSDWHECVSVERDSHIMTAKASVSHFCTNVMMRFYLFVGTIYLAGHYAIGILHLAESDNDTSRPFPTKLQLPSEAEQSPIYELLVVTTFVHVMLHSYTLVILNALMFSLVLHASGQIEIICEKFRIASEKIHNHKSSNYAIGMLIEKHNKIIVFSRNVDKLFSFMALMQIFWNTLVICPLGLLVISSVHNNASVSLVRTLLGYSVVMLEIFIFCFAGEYLSLKSKSLSAAAYESLWYNMSSNEAKNILFVIMRSQRQLSITAGGIANLSLEVFANIMKSSASYVSVLHAMY